MSLEAVIAELKASVDKNTAALERIAGAAKSGAAQVAAKSETTKPAGTSKPSTKPKVLTEEDIRNTFGGYMSGAKDKDEKATRKANVAAVIAHFGVDKATSILEENREEAIGYIKQFEAGETPNFMDEGGGDEDDGGSMI